MAQTTQVNFRIDKDIKQEAERELESMGLSLSAAITLFLKKVCIEHRIPFEITNSDANNKDIEDAVKSEKE